MWHPLEVQRAPEMVILTSWGPLKLWKDRLEVGGMILRGVLL